MGRFTRLGALFLSTLLGCAPKAPDPATWTPVALEQGWPDEAGLPIAIPEVLSELSWLGDISLYGQQGLPQGRGSSGSFGLGNGLVFGLLGLDSPWNTLTNLVGPGYQVHGGFFGDSSVLLLDGNEELEILHQIVQRPRGSAVVRSALETATLTLTTDDVAVTGQPLIARLLTLRNTGTEPAQATLRILLARGPQEAINNEAQALIQQRGPNTLRVRCPDASVSVSDSSMDLILPSLSAGEERSLLCLYEFSKDGSWPPAIDMAQALTEHRAALTAYLDPAMHLDSPDPKVTDLYEGMLVTLYTQTTDTGLVSPMNRYTKGWLRDAEGAVRLWLAAGLHERVRSLLDSVYQAVVVRATLSNSFDLDVDRTSFAEPDDPEAFFAAIPFMPNRNAAEAPSHVVLQHSWYLEHSGDTSILEGGRPAYLDACLLRQDMNAEGLLPFSTDETYRFPMAGVLGGMPEDLGWSAHSGILLAAAAQRLQAWSPNAEVAARGELARSAIEELFWVNSPGFYSPLLNFDSLAPMALPYEDVSTQPLWLGYSRADEDRALQNTNTLARLLQREDGTLLSPESSTGGPNYSYTGMVPGYWLQNTAAVAHPSRELAFQALDRVATPSGHFEEMHSPDNSAFVATHDPTGLGSDVTARYRPWEGGDVVAALLEYFVGQAPDASAQTLTLTPHLPASWPWLRLQGLRMGDERWDLELEQYQEGLLLRLYRGGGSSSSLWDLTLILDTALGAELPRWIYIDGVGQRAPEESLPGRLLLPTLKLEPDSSLQILLPFGKASSW